MAILGAFDADPFACMMGALPNETPVEKAAREKREAAAQRVSDKIDEELKQERARLKKEKSIVRVLLLGQSESGKSTTLKNFRMTYARAAWMEERKSWRSVIQLNVLRSILLILTTLEAEMNSDPPKTLPPLSPVNVPKPISPDSSPLTSPSLRKLAGELPSSPTTTAPSSNTIIHLPISPHFTFGASFSIPGTTTTSINPAPGTAGTSSFSSIYQQQQQQHYNSHYSHQRTVSRLKACHQLLKLRLAPLRTVEKDLKRQLGAATEEEASMVMDDPLDPNGWGADNDEVGWDEHINPLGLRKPPRKLEFGVRVWRDVVCGETPNPKTAPRAKSPTKVIRGQDEPYDGVDEATDIIASCREDMKTLWSDADVQTVLQKRKVRLQDSAGFFLDDLDRIATRGYEPSDDDILRARLRTLAVQEHKIQFDQQQSTGSQIFNSVGLNSEIGNDWIIYDVGGSRTIRRAWLPYFDNVNAIIFLAPISCFDERLNEDTRVNRLEDSFLLWRAVCRSPLLASSTMILFLNKCDLLKRKLKSGVMVKDYLPSYGDRANDPSTVTKYLRENFKDILRQQSPGPRVSYFYATSVTDTKATAITLKTVRDSILREHLKNADFV